MPFENGRFALLAVLCGLAAQSLSPSGGAGVRAAIVHRQPKAAANQFARRDIGKVADYDSASLQHNQAAFSFPWSKQSNKMRRSQKRSIIAISNPHGAKYTINHRRQATTPQWVSVPPRNATSNSTASTSSTPERTAGTVAIVSRDDNPMNNHVLASLYLVESNGTYVLDASDRNATEVFLSPEASSSEMSAGTSDTYLVRLAMPVDGEPYCATYDQAPPNPEPLTAQRCMGDGVRTGRESQIFIYNSSSGLIQPTYSDGGAEDAGTSSAYFSAPSSTPSASMGAANADVVMPSDSASPTPSGNASSASWNRRDDSGSYTAQNVTLMFVPRKATSNVAAAAVQEVSTSTVITTSTQTVIVFSSAAPLSASAVSAADTTPSPIVSSSSSAGMAGVTGLSVEVVGKLLGLPQAPLSVGMAASGQPAKTPAPSNSPSPSVDAAAVDASSTASSTAPTTPSPSVAAVASVASLSSSDNSAASVSPALSSSSAKPLFERNAAKVTPVSTEPYFWRFKAERRI